MILANKVILGSRVPVKADGAEIKNTEPCIYLSPPHMGDAELELVKEAFATNWIAPVGPHVDSFEKEFAEYLGVRTQPRSPPALRRSISPCDCSGCIRATKCSALH